MLSCRQKGTTQLTSVKSSNVHVGE